MFRRRSIAPTFGLVVEEMRSAHLDEVMVIERSSFPAPWSRSLYHDELSATRDRIYLVAREDGKVIGFVGAMIVIDEVHITTIAVRTDRQGRSIGTLLLYHVLAKAVARDVSAATLEVRISNDRAQSLYHRFGFLPAGIRKNYYAEVHEDGLVMWAYDLQSESYADRMVEIAGDLRSKALPLPEGLIGGSR